MLSNFPLVLFYLVHPQNAFRLRLPLLEIQEEIKLKKKNNLRISSLDPNVH